MNFNYDKIPLVLKKMNRWVLWKKIKSEKGFTKVPVNARNGYGAKSNDNTTWCDFETALKNCDKFLCDGLGFMLGNGVFGVDLDCHKDNEQFRELVDEFIGKLKSYTEYSQSGKGIHIICKGVLPKGNRRKGDIEMYDNVRFFALTGNVVAGTESFEVEDRTGEIKELHSKYLNDTSKEGYVFTKERYNYNAGSKLTDNEIFTKISESKQGALFNCLYYGSWEGIYPSQSEADMSLCMILAFWSNKDFEQIDRIFRKSNLYRDKWDRKLGDSTYGAITINNAISKCKDTYIPKEYTHDMSFNADTGEVSVVNKKDYDLNDTGNAKRFIDTFGRDFRYHFDNKYWMIWDGKTWVQDKEQNIKLFADQLIEMMKKEMFDEDDETLRKEMMKNIKHLSSNSGKEAMLKEAMHLKGVPVLARDFDKNDFLLNCENGVVDLKTGEIIEHDRSFMCSRNTNIVCDMENEPVLFIKFLKDIFFNDEVVIDYIRKCLGYSLTGSVQEQCLFQCIGTGGNGKSVLFDVIYDLLGSYALNIQVQSILAKNGGSGSNANSDIARLNGCRWVRTTEPTEGQRFDEGLVKQLTGGDVITARFLYGTEFEYKAKFKLWISCNYEIEVRGTDDGIWRRMRLIRFNKKFDEKTADKNLTNKLKQELPQILGWLVKGCLEWQKAGLVMPETIRQDTNKYKEKNNIVAIFMAQNIEVNEKSKEKASDVYKEYKEWAKNGNLYCMNQERFGEEMSKHFKKEVYGGYVYYKGFCLKKNSKKYVYMNGD